MEINNLTYFCINVFYFTFTTKKKLRTLNRSCTLCQQLKIKIYIVSKSIKLRDPRNVSELVVSGMYSNYHGNCCGVTSTNLVLLFFKFGQILK